jgi:hypothetical protein
MVGRAGADGVVVFEVNRPIPPLMDVFVWWADPSSNPEVHSTRTISEDGVVAHWPPTGVKKPINGAPLIRRLLGRRRNWEKLFSSFIQ